MKLQKKFFESRSAVTITFATGVILAVSGSVLASSIGTNLSVTGTATVTGATTLTGLGTMTAGYVSQASSTVVGALTVGQSNLATLTGGYVSQASSTIVGNLTLTGISSATSTWLSAGFISPASSTVSGAFTVGVGNLTTLAGGYISSASSTIVGNLTLTGISSATSTWLSAGFISPASSTVSGAFTVGVGNLTTLAGGYTSSASSSVINRFLVTGAATVGGNGNGMLGVGTSTPSRELSVAGSVLVNSTSTTATSSVIISSGNPSGTTIGGCINLRATNGTMVRIYATSSPTAVESTNAGNTTGYKNLIVEAGSCEAGGTQ